MGDVFNLTDDSFPWYYPNVLPFAGLVTTASLNLPIARIRKHTIFHAGGRYS